MTTFKNNFNNAFSQIKNDQKCYWIIYKSIPHTITCNGKSVSVELPVAPEKINHNISQEWWAANQNRIQQIVPCDSVALDIDSSGKIPFCVISSSQDPNLNSTRDCALLYPEEQQLIQFLQNNNCDTTDSTNPVVIWYNNILDNNPKISPSPQQFFSSFAEACNNCDIFCNTCVPFSESVGVNSLLTSNGSIISGNNVSIRNNTINLDDHFDTNLKPIVAYSKDSVIGKFASSNSELSSFNFTVPSKLGFDKALFINDQGQVSSQDVVPGQMIPLSDTIILGSTTTTGTLSLNNQLPPSPPTILSFRIVNSEAGPSTTVITIAPNPRISNEDIVTSYAFRFNGVATAPKRVGPAPAVQDGPEQLLENEYEFNGLLDGQYLTVASVGSSSIGTYSHPFFLGSGCCYISDGAIFDGTEESCQEYSTDRELSYTWSENSCVPTGSWNTGYLVASTGLFQDKFYITGCQSGSFDEWASYYSSGIATNFNRNISCSDLATTYDSFRIVPTGDNVNVVISPDMSVTFSKVLSEGTVSVNQTQNGFSFFTTASTSGDIGLSLSQPSGFLPGNEITSLADNGCLTSVPFILSDGKINCPNIFGNLTHYYNASGDITDLNYNTQEYSAGVIKRTSAIFGFAPSGFGFVSQFGQHYINLIHAHSNEVYFVDARESRVDLSSYVSTSYLDRFVYPTPIYSASSLSSSNNDNFEACVALDPPQGWWDPDARDIDPDFGLPLKPIYTELFNIPCENPFYTRGGYNINNLFTFECGCWITLVTRQQLMDLAALIASIVLAITRLHRLVAVLGTELAANQAELADKIFQQNSYLGEAEFHKGICDGIQAEYPNIPGAFNPGNLPPGWVVVFPDSSFNPSMEEVLQHWEPDGNGGIIRTSWDEYLRTHPEATDLHDLDEIYSEWQRYVDNLGRQAEAEGRARGLGWDISHLKDLISGLEGQIGACWAQIAGLAAALAAYRNMLNDFMQGPAVSYRKECAIEGFEFCEHNFVYEICGGVEEPKAYWQKGYAPDGTRLTMPQGWPSCDCCAPCESCNPNPPSLGWSGYDTPSPYSPCQICPPGYSIMPGIPGPDYFVPLGDPPENPVSDNQCDNNRAPVCCFVGDDPDLVWNETNWSLWPFTDGPHWTNIDGVWGCYYMDPNTGFYTTKEHYLAKRCINGDCIEFCD